MNRSNAMRRAFFGLVLVAVFATGNGDAAEIRVDSGEVAILQNDRCSLREALINAHYDTAEHADCRPGNGPDVIVLAPNSDYELIGPIADGATVGLPGILTEVTIEGRGSTIRRSDRGGTAPFRLLATSDADLVLRDLTFEGGLLETGMFFEGGAAIYMRGGRLVAENVRFIDNGVYPNGRGGAVLISSGDDPTRAHASFRDCLFTGNHVDSIPGQHTTGGGAINIQNGELVIERCAFIGNRTRMDPAQTDGGAGGAIFISDLASRIDGHGFGTTANIRDSTFSDNHASSAGAIYLQSVQGFWLQLYLQQVTMTKNRAMGPVAGIGAHAGTSGQVYIGYVGSILHGNGNPTTGRDCVTTGGMPRVYWESYTGNLLGPDRGCAPDQFGDDFLDEDVWAHIEPDLVDNGHDLKPDSVLVDVVSGGLCDHGVSRDQRGRIRGGGSGQGGVHCDIGAVEFYGKDDDTIFRDGFESGG